MSYSKKSCSSKNLRSSFSAFSLESEACMMFSGYNKNGKEVLQDAMFTDVNSKDLVMVKDIQFYSTCEHHMMPFFGTVTIAYVPQDGKIDHGAVTVSITGKNLSDYLGKKKYHPDKVNKHDEAGIVRGLAWTSAGWRYPARAYAYAQAP